MREHTKLYLKGLLVFLVGIIGLIIHIKLEWEFFPFSAVIAAVGYIMIIRSYQWGHHRK